jgi:hypothetical protein
VLAGLVTCLRLSVKAENRGVVVAEAGSYLRLIDSCVTQLKAQGPSRTCNESKEEEDDDVGHPESSPYLILIFFHLISTILLIDYYRLVNGYGSSGGVAWRRYVDQVLFLINNYPSPN